MRKYELMFIVRPDIPAEEVDKLIAQMEGITTNLGGRVARVDKLGVRRLAYRVQRQREGFYVLFVLEGDGALVKEFERRLKVTDSVIKFLTVRIDEEEKHVEKMKQWRAKREQKRPRSRPAPAAPPLPTLETLPENV